MKSNPSNSTVRYGIPKLLLDSGVGLYPCEERGESGGQLRLVFREILAGCLRQYVFSLPIFPFSLFYLCIFYISTAVVVSVETARILTCSLVDWSILSEISIPMNKVHTTDANYTYF
jgi:hypothetical protein